MNDIIIQIIGFVGMLCHFVSFQQKKRKGILFFQICASAVFLVHFALLGAYTGAILNVIGLFRALVFMNNDKKWAQSSVWLWVFIIAFTASSIATWESWYSILPTTGMILTTVSYWLKNETKIRLITFPGSPCWLIYNAINGSFSGVLTECMVMTSLIIAIVRYDILKKGKEITNEN